MGYAMAIGPCIGCGQIFPFNPMRVPSVRVNGEREPVCRACVERANPERIKRGLAPITVLPGAYEPADEGYL
jgi:hypothetical protein